MNSRRILIKKLFFLPLIPLSGFVNAHTPYRQWKVVRKKHLLIYSNREDLKTDELAEQVNKVLKQFLPDAKSMVARGRNYKRIASILTTGQGMLALFKKDQAQNLFNGEYPYKGYSGKHIRVICQIDGYYLLSNTSFKNDHAILVYDTLIDHHSKTIKISDNSIPLHRALIKYESQKSNH
tara:strand:- start:52 stop:591 length:540 start_codon:yes stop_codon:yes gene_type:complete